MPRRRKGVPPPWWLDPDNLARAEFNMLLMGKPAPPQAVMFTWFVTQHNIEVLKLWRRLSRRDPSDLFKTPASAESSRKPGGSPEELLERAFHELISVAIYAHLLRPAQIVVGGPRDLDDPGDVLGVERVRNVEAWRRKGLDYPKLAHVKGVAGKVLGVTIKLFGGKPLIGMTQALTRIVTGVSLSRDEVRSHLP
jgi:hypothetical protein